MQVPSTHDQRAADGVQHHCFLIKALHIGDAADTQLSAVVQRQPVDPLLRRFISNIAAPFSVFGLAILSIYIRTG